MAIYQKLQIKDQWWPKIIAKIMAAHDMVLQSIRANITYVLADIHSN